MGSKRWDVEVNTFVATGNTQLDMQMQCTGEWVHSSQSEGREK